MSAHSKTLDLHSLPPEAHEAFEGWQAENLRLQTLLKFKDEQIRLLNLKHWGPKADTFSEAQLALLPQELVVIPPEVELEAGLPGEKMTSAPKAKTPRSPHPGRSLATRSGRNWIAGQPSSSSECPFL